MKRLLTMLLAVLAFVPMLAVAQDAPKGAVVVQKDKDKGTASRTEVVVLQGAITAIDQATREVTIKGGGGNEVVLVAGPEVKNFAQLKVGDIVTMTALQSLALELKKNGKAIPSRVESGDKAKAAPGEKPMGAEARRVTVVADVQAVDMKTGKLTLRGPQRTVDLMVKDKSMLTNVKVGDQIEATYTEAMAIKVKPGKPAKASK